MSDSVRPHRRQPTRLLCPRDSPGKNTGVGCHFLLQCMKVKSESEVAQSCPTLSDPMDWSLPGSSVHGIFQARALEWCAIRYKVLMFYKTLVVLFVQNFCSYLLFIFLLGCLFQCSNQYCFFPILSLWVVPEHWLWVPCFMHRTCIGLDAP